MKKSLLIGTLFLLALPELLGQESVLQGTYQHQKKKEIDIIYDFHEDRFTYIESGDMGVFQGAGSFKMNERLLILVFHKTDSTRNQRKDYYQIQQKTDTLMVERINKKEFSVQRPLTNGRVYKERYRKVKKQYRGL